MKDGRGGINISTNAAPAPVEQGFRNQQLLWALGFGGFLVNSDNRAIAPMLAAIAIALHTTPSAAALLVTAYSIPYGVFQLAYGPLADRIGKVRTIVLSLCLFALGTVGCAVVHRFSALLVLRVLTGMFAAGIIPTSLAQIGDRFAYAERSKAIAFFMSLCTSGQALGIVIGGIVAQFLSYRFLFLILGVAALPALWTLLRQRAAETTPQSAPPSLPLADRYKALLRRRFVWLIYGLVLAEGLVFYGGFTFLGVYGVNNLHLSYFVIGLLTATYSLGAFAGSRTIAPLVARIGTRRMPIFGAGILTCGFAIIWGWPTVPALTLGFIVLGFGFSYCHSTLQTFATDLLPSARATAMSLFAFSLFLGSGLGPMVTGRIYDVLGMHWMLGLVTAGMGGFALCCLTLLQQKQRSDHTTTLSV
ncbi:MFS transporter [Alicyclobacillus cycloheptanicus]|uniref:MFS family arabinose efflux permease n=1 Tax=Alicyclobacillus cycloheptanicus TaxID=1457 RepID=A0ABT9XKK2_9BACL|nr:MFS transporter [Alicyclobacillus cycloheptanicus]MDQ0190800.1 putative MFS family arabinose efflux permease [Alicyclobacillus cycloheptanicus]WDM02718.1 MFS transporter [Alicyclobacillus cycloheptanicus]